MHAGKIIRMHGKTGKDMTRGEVFSSASFTYSPSFIYAPSQGLDCHKIADYAVSALLSEVNATPKPGLVDRDNNGAHKDMDYAMFLSSAKSLHSCFLNCAKAAKDADISHLPSKLRAIGLAGEAAMYEATGGVNTHKGAIFSIGILCAAAAISASAPLDAPCAEGLQHLCKSIASSLLQSDTAAGTHGLKALKATGTGGIRKEALSGFATAFEIGLPSFEEALEAGRSENDAAIYCLLSILEATEDSNLVHRGGVEGMDFGKKEAKRLLRCGAEYLDIQEVRKLDEEFIRRNLSPGGSADLLAFSVMLLHLKSDGFVEHDI